MNNSPNTGSNMIAGVLGIVLGWAGVHQWYLGEQKKAKKHIILLISGVAILVVSMILQALMPSAAQLTLRTTLGNISTVLRVVAWLVIIADIVWGIIEGVLLLIQGDTESAGQSSPNVPVNTPPLAANPNTQQSSPVNSTTDVNQPQPLATPQIPNQTQAAAATSTDNLIFKSSDIQNPAPVPRPDQAVGTKDVPAPALTVQDERGKEKMNPVVRRWVLSGVVLVISAAILGLMIKGGLDSILSSAYGETYRAAKELKPLIDKAHNSSACEYAVQYVKSAYVDRKTYDEYIDTCKSLTESDALALIDRLGETPMLRWNAEIAQEYDSFREEFIATFPTETNFDPALQLYQTWHNYALATDILTVESADVEFQAAADILRTSGNSTLSEYGELWLEKELEYIHAYRAYQDASYTDPNKDTLRQNYETLRSDLQAWVADHRPDVTEMEKIRNPNTDALYESFTKMYNLIKTGYEKHYDRNSGDCNDSGKTVYCA